MLAIFASRIFESFDISRGFCSTASMPWLLALSSKCWPWYADAADMKGFNMSICFLENWCWTSRNTPESYLLFYLPWTSVSSCFLFSCTNILKKSRKQALICRLISSPSIRGMLTSVITIKKGIWICWRPFGLFSWMFLISRERSAW